MPTDEEVEALDSVIMQQARKAAKIATSANTRPIGTLDTRANSHSPRATTRS